MTLLGSPVIGQLTAEEFRAWLALLSYVARWRGECDHLNGEFPREWAKFATYAKADRQGRVTPKRLERFVSLGLLEELVDLDGKAWLRVVDWRDLHPLEWTGAIRQERWRDRHGYVGRRRIGSPASPAPTRESPAKDETVSQDDHRPADTNARDSRFELERAAELRAQRESET